MGNGLTGGNRRRNHTHVGSGPGAGGFDPVHMAGGIGRNRKPQRIGKPSRAVGIGCQLHGFGMCVRAAAAHGVAAARTLPAAPVVLGIAHAVDLAPEDVH